MPEARNHPEEFYAEHAAEWASRTAGAASLWVWSGENDWHRVCAAVESAGWQLAGVNVWHKGTHHPTGTARHLHKFPSATELCAHFEMPALSACGRSAQEWLRFEWQRTGLPFSDANKACGVKNAASRKYLASDHEWYPPPPDAFAMMAAWANEHGSAEHRPYLDVSASFDGIDPSLPPEEAWASVLPRFSPPEGWTNVWESPPGHGLLGRDSKPVPLVRMLVRATTLPGQAVWAPFGADASVAEACWLEGLRCETAVPEHDAAVAAGKALHGLERPLFPDERVERPV